MEAPETSIIIRTRNEETWLGETLKRLTEQTYKDFEIIIIDSESTDKTLEIASQFPVTVFSIKATDFTYPYAINYGIKRARATKYFVILSAHSLPIDENWLQSGIDKFSLQSNVLGVYGPLLALPKSTLSDKLIHGLSYLRSRLKMYPKSYFIAETLEVGILGFTNAIIRKDLWEQYPVNEKFAGGGEDWDWVSHWLQNGYVAVKDLGFTVRHSHNLGPIGWYKQVQHWKSSGAESVFTYLDYRKDGAHREDMP